MWHAHPSLAPRSGGHVLDIIWYIRAAIAVEFGVFGVYWIALYVAVLAAGTYGALLALVVPGVHFASPFAALELLNFFEDKWLNKPRRLLRFEVGRWVAQCGVTLVADVVALTNAILVDAPALAADGHSGTARALVAFFALLVINTFLLTAALVSAWQSIRHYAAAHTGGPSAADQKLLEETRNVYLPPPHDGRRA